MLKWVYHFPGLLPLAPPKESSDFSGGQEESSLLTIPASPSSTASLEVSILDDEVVETSPELFSVSISSSQTGVTVAGSDTANISIYDNDCESLCHPLYC